jgi:hypothetical protein
MATRRGNPARYFVQLDNQQMFRLSAARWHTWVAAKLLTRLSKVSRIAKPAQKGVVWLQDGELHIKPDAIYPWINLNCRQIEQHALFDTSGPKLEPHQIQREIQREYGGID